MSLSEKSQFRSKNKKQGDSRNTDSDDYSEEWSLAAGSVSVSGDSKTLTYTWNNTYGEFGTVDLTYDDGSSWPALTN